MTVAAACSGDGGQQSGTAASSSSAPVATIDSTTTSSVASSTTAGTTTSTAPTTSLAAPTTTVAPAPATTSAKPPVTVAPTPTDPNVPEGAPAQRISRGANGKPIVALSFDAGSDFGYAGQILDYLQAEGIKASFGMTGKWAEQNPDTFRRIVNEGHHLINHTYSHQSWTGVSSGRLPLSKDARIDELERADAVFVALAGKSAKPWFRPPYGDIDGQTEKLLGQQGYKYNAMWTLDSLGWQGLSADAIAARCIKALAPGVILLFHVGSQSEDANALPAIVAAIRAAGLQPGTIADVI
jgi:peptidoglycan/xylan/chitin deacetylase (PgdA/CDA1 family)